MLPSTPPSTGSYIFYNAPLETVYVVDEDAKTAYQTGYLWSRYEIVVMPTGIEEVETDKTAPHHCRLLRPEWQTNQRQTTRRGHRALLRWHYAQGAEVTARKDSPSHRSVQL